MRLLTIVVKTDGWYSVTEEILFAPRARKPSRFICDCTGDPIGTVGYTYRRDPAKLAEFVRKPQEK